MARKDDVDRVPLADVSVAFPEGGRKIETGLAKTGMMMPSAKDGEEEQRKKIGNHVESPLFLGEREEKAESNLRTQHTHTRP